MLLFFQWGEKFHLQIKHDDVNIVSVPLGFVDFMTVVPIGMQFSKYALK